MLLADRSKGLQKMGVAVCRFWGKRVAAFRLLRHRGPNALSLPRYRNRWLARFALAMVDAEYLSACLAADRRFARLRDQLYPYLAGSDVAALPQTDLSQGLRKNGHKKLTRLEKCFKRQGVIAIGVGFRIELVIGRFKLK